MSCNGDPSISKLPPPSPYVEAALAGCTGRAYYPVADPPSCPPPLARPDAVQTGATATPEVDLLDGAEDAALDSFLAATAASDRAQLGASIIRALVDEVEVLVDMVHEKAPNASSYNPTPPWVSLVNDAIAGLTARITLEASKL